GPLNGQNNVLILVYGKSAPYNEILNINSGLIDNMRIFGAATGERAVLNGRLNFINTAIGTTTNVYVEGMRINGVNGQSAITTSGTDLLNLTIKDCELVKNDVDGFDLMNFGTIGAINILNSKFTRDTDPNCAIIRNTGAARVTARYSEFIGNVGSANPLNSVYVSPIGALTQNIAVFEYCTIYYGGETLFYLHPNCDVECRWNRIIFGVNNGQVFYLNTAAADINVWAEFNEFYRNIPFGAGFIARNAGLGGGSFLNGYNTYVNGSNIQNTIALINLAQPLNPLP
ncbi:MAG: hypothetical protein SFU25_12090, partial [Candidatus Caenarcaniphilales bacterium]|nr:hypothetical protein [Candidatus Caenarcaniphilales bacterium]